MPPGPTWALALPGRINMDQPRPENTLARYAELIDAGDFAGIGQLFAHGTITDAAGVAIASGAEQVTRLYETTTRRFADDGTPKTKHIASNVIVDLSADGRTASVRSYFVVMQRVGDEPLRPIVAGRYHDRLELTDGAAARVAAALDAETAVREAAIATLRSRQVFALVAAAAAAVLVILLLYQTADEPIIRRLPEARPANMAEAASARVVGTTSAPAAVTQGIAVDAPSPPETIAARETGDAVDQSPAPVLPALSPATESSAADFSDLASLCTDMARVVDTQQLPGLLERASSLLDAQGIILWIADPDARELNPILAQGYPAQLLNRLGALPRDAENATAAAFRTSLLQTVKSEADSNGAIAAPLVTSSGCVGVMAAEVRNEAEQRDVKLAAAAIMAAQLATLVGPPPAQRSKVEAAGA